MVFGHRYVDAMQHRNITAGEKEYIFLTFSIAVFVCKIENKQSNGTLGGLIIQKYKIKNKKKQPRISEMASMQNK